MPTLRHKIFRRERDGGNLGETFDVLSRETLAYAKYCKTSYLVSVMLLSSYQENNAREMYAIIERGKINREVHEYDETIILLSIDPSIVEKMREEV